MEQDLNQDQIETMETGASNGVEANGVPHGTDEGDVFGFAKPSTQVRAWMPVSRDSEVYNMTHPRRGLALLFNHRSFFIASLKERNGTDVDCLNLQLCLEQLGFEVKVFHNLTKKRIHEEIEKASTANHTDCDCILVAIMTHGEQNILYSCDSDYKPEFIWNSFAANKCPTLAGKPKLFFIQACQGEYLDGGVVLERTEVDSGGTSNSYKIPAQADVLIAYSTIPGYYSWRNTTNGSWFIQALCAELKKNGTTKDLLSMLTNVNRRVALDYESNVPGNPSMDRQKQIPCITSMLMRQVYFFKTSVNTTNTGKAWYEKLLWCK